MSLYCCSAKSLIFVKHPENKLDGFVKRRNSIEGVIPAKAGIRLFQDVLDPGACPGPDPGFAGVTTQETFYETVKSR